MSFLVFCIWSSCCLHDLIVDLLPSGIIDSFGMHLIKFGNDLVDLILYRVSKLDSYCLDCLASVLYMVSELSLLSPFD